MRGMAKRAGRDRNPLEPLASFSGMLLYFYAAAALMTIYSMATGSGTFLGLGRGVFVCATSKDAGGDIEQTSWFRLHAGVNLNPSSLELCASKPNAEQRWLYSIQQLPDTITALAVVLLTYLVLRQAARFGLYSAGMATRLRILGWFLVAESVIGPTIEVYASRTLWHTMADGPQGMQWGLGYTALFAGLALLSLARIMRVGTAMREDLEAVV